VSLNQVTLSLDVYDGGGNLIRAGEALFTPSVPLVDGVDHLYVWQRPIVVSLVPPAGSGGGWLPTVTLYATDSTNLSPSGWAWQVEFQAPGAPAGYSFFLAYANGASQYLDDLAPAVSVTTMQSYLPLPSGTPSAGEVPVATGPGPATAWGTPSGSGVASVTAADTSVVVGGTGTNPTVRTNTLDVIASQHAPAANWSNNSHKITSVANGSAASDAAAFGQLPSSSSPLGTLAGGTGLSESTAAALLAALGALQAASNLSDVSAPATARVNLGLTWKDPVQQVTVSALPANTYSSGAQTLTATANGALSIDSVAVAVGQRCLVCDEATAQNNGIYLVTATGSGSAPYVLTRAPDMTTGTQVTGAAVMVEQGTLGAGSGWFVEGAGPDTIGTTAIFWTRFTSVISTAAAQPLGTAAAGSTGFVADAGHVHANPANQQPADQNLVSWAYDPAVITNTASPATGTVQLIRVILRSAQTVTNVLAHIGAGGTGLVSAKNYGGLYSAAGTLLSATADQTTAWASTGLQTMALATQQVNLAAGIYYAALLANETAGTTPAFARNNGITAASGLINAGLAVATARFATGPAGQNTLPGTITMSGLTFATVAYWAALS
jgi:hypothetical protein